MNHKKLSTRWINIQKAWNVLIILGMLLATSFTLTKPAQADAGWTAYNDVVSVTGEPTTNITTYTTSGSTSGLLKNFATGSNTAVTLSISTSGTISRDTTYGGEANSGTDAYTTFNGKAGLKGNIKLGSSASTMTARFTGLNPAKSYTFAATANRNESSYTRNTTYTISDFSAATNASTSGATVTSTTATFNTGYNAENGFVARWTGVQPGSDGDFTVTATVASGSEAYGFSVIMLKEEGIEYTLTAGNDGNGSVTLNPAGGIYGEGSVVTLTPVPNSGYQFSSWSGANAADLTSNGDGTYSITMNSNKTVTANFIVSLCSTDALTAIGDTYISTANVTYNYGGVNLFKVSRGTGSSNNRGALIKWDLSNIPSNATVSSASLKMYVIQSSSQTFNLYNMRRTWVEGDLTTGAASTTSANWNTFDGTTSWGTAGAANTSSDREDTNLWGAGSSTFSSTGSKTVNLNASGLSVVQGWVENPGTNNGLTIQNYTSSSVSSNELHFASSENGTVANRPVLNISYCVPVTGPTIILKGTLSSFTAEPGIPSAVQTYQVAGVNLTDNIAILAPSGFEISTAGGDYGSSLSLGPTGGSVADTTISVRLNSSSVGTYSGNIEHTSGLATPQPLSVNGTVAVEPTLVTFQEGAAGYAGTLDTTIKYLTQTTSYGTAVELEWDTEETNGTSSPEIALLQFSNLFGGGSGQIPNNSTIQSAVLQYRVGGTTNNSGDTASVYESLVSWDEATTYATFGGDTGVQPEEYNTTLIATASAAALSTNYTVDVTASLQRWSDGTANYGWIFLAGGTDGVSIHSSESATSSYHPLLTVSYTPPSGPQYTLTAGNDGNGSVTLSPAGGTYAENTVVNLTPVPGSGYTFDNWTGANAGDLSDNGNGTWAITMTANKTVTANFRILPVNHVPNAPVLVSPLDNATGVSTSPALEVNVTDPDSDVMNVSFYARQAGGIAGEDFTFVFLPDTQYYSQSYPDTFNAQTQWIKDNQDSKNIVFVSHAGDLANTASSASQYITADTAIDILDNSNIPFSVAPGNHDIPTTNFNTYFGVSRFSGKPYYGGHYGSTNDNNYSLFSSSGMDFIVINLQYNADSNILEWADDLLETYSARRAIVVQHDMLTYTNAWVNQTTYNTLRDNPNLFLMLCGHMHSSTDGAAYVAGSNSVNGETIHVVMADYQEFAQGGSGYLRTLRFSPSDDTIYMQTYSPTLDQYITTSPDKMDLAYDMPEVNPFTLIGTDSNVASGENASVNYPGLANSTEYEWFTEASDAAETTASSVWSFTTQSPVNHAPVCSGTTLSTPEDIAGQATPSCTDEDGNTLTYSIVDQPAVGSAAVNSGMLAFTPPANYFGTTSFTYKANDGLLDSNTATVSVTVTPVNDLPVADAQSVTTPEETTLAITLTGSDLESSVLGFVIVSAPTHGSLNGTTADVIYTPAADYSGEDSFTFKVNDGTDDSVPATVSISVSPLPDAPTATPQNLSTAEDTPLGVTLTGVDPDGDSLVFSVASTPAHGTLTGTAPGLTYTPDANYFGADAFTFTASDGTTTSGPATVSINVTAVNDAPTANNLSASTDEDTPVNITLSGSDVEGGSLTFSVASGPAHGALSGTAPNLTYTPDANFNGADSFTYTARDGTDTGSPATVSITVAPLPDAPVAIPQSLVTDEDTALAVTLTGSDPDGDALTFRVIDQPDNGSLTGSGANRTYSPNANYFGADSFVFEVGDGSGATSTATVSLTVNPVNDVPEAYGQAVTTSEDTPAGITLSAFDVEGQTLEYEIFQNPAHGALSGTAPNLTYTPDPGYNAEDSFLFRVSDGSDFSNFATISITVNPVNDAPVSQDGSFGGMEDSVLNGNLAATDEDSPALTFSKVADPAHGNVVVNADGSFTYTPQADYDGSDSFTFKASDGELDSNVATASITLTGVNDAPQASPQSVDVDEDAPETITLGGVDVDGDALTFSVVDSPLHGVLSGTAPDLTYTPEAGYIGNDSFTFKAADAALESSPATISITVHPVNDAPTANDLAIELDEDTSAPITLSGSDVEGSALTYETASAPAHGTLSGTAPNLTYTPDADFSGSDAFTYTANDGDLTSAPATVSITVNGTNDVPSAYGGTVSTNEDTPRSLTLNVLDIDGDILSFSIITSPEHGTLSGSGPQMTYTPDADFNGSDFFTYKASDGTAESNSAMITVVVTPVNDAPSALDQAVTAVEDTPLDITLTGSDVDGDVLTFSVVDGPAYGSLSGTPPHITYTPAADFIGSDSFTFKAADAALDSLPGIIQITVTPDNDAPTATPQSAATDEETPVGIVLAGTDPEGDSLTFAVLTQPGHGALSGEAPNLTYTPELDFTGVDTFTFKANDGSSDSAPATVSITVHPLNDAPLALPQTVQTSQDTPKAFTLTGSDVDGDMLTFEVLTQPAHGALSGTAPDLTYTPDAAFEGSDSFTFKVSDGLLESAPALVSINVHHTNKAPNADGQTVSTAEDTARSITLTGSDPESDLLSFSVVDGPDHGTLSGTGPDLTYTPNANFNGSDAFTFKTNDGALDSTPATVSITVAPVNDAPSASGQTVTTPEDVPAAMVLSAADVDGDTLAFTLTSQPQHGTLSGTAPNLTYTPDGDFNGSDAFTFKADDGLLESPVVTVNITVSPVNDAPDAANDSYVADQDIPLVVSAGDGVLKNDSDKESGSLSAVVATTTAHGTLTLNADGSFTYVPNAGFSGLDSFTYRAFDGAAYSPAASASILVTGIPVTGERKIFLPILRR